MTRATVKGGVKETQLKLPLPSVLTTQQIEEIVMEWYRNQALTCFSERIAFYADKLGVARPQLRLSRHSILARDNYTCQYCGVKNKELTIDHVTPRWVGPCRRGRMAVATPPRR